MAQFRQGIGPVQRSGPFTAQVNDKYREFLGPTQRLGPFSAQQGPAPAPQPNYLTVGGRQMPFVPGQYQMGPQDVQISNPNGQFYTVEQLQQMNNAGGGNGTLPNGGQNQIYGTPYIDPVTGLPVGTNQSGNAERTRPPVYTRPLEPVQARKGADMATAVDQQRAAQIGAMNTMANRQAPFARFNFGNRMGRGGAAPAASPEAASRQFAGQQAGNAVQQTGLQPTQGRFRRINAFA